MDRSSRDMENLGYGKSLCCLMSIGSKWLQENMLLETKYKAQGSFPNYWDEIFEPKSDFWVFYQNYATHFNITHPYAPRLICPWKSSKSLDVSVTVPA